MTVEGGDSDPAPGESLWNHAAEAVNDFLLLPSAKTQLDEKVAECESLKKALEDQEKQLRLLGEEMSEMKAKMTNDYAALEASSAQKYAALEAKSAEEYAALEVKSAEEYAELEAKSAEEYAALEAKSAEEYEALEAKLAEEYAALEAKSTEEYAALQVKSEEEYAALEIKAAKEYMALEGKAAEERATLGSHIAKLKKKAARVDALETQSSHLFKAVEKAEKVEEEKKALVTDRDNLKKELEGLRQREGELQDKLQEVEERASRLARSDAKMEKLREEIRLLRRGNNRLESENERLEVDSQSLNVDVEEKSRLLSDAHDLLREVENERDRFKSSSYRLSDELSDLKTAAEKCEVDRSQLLSKCDVLEAENERLVHAVATSNQENAILEGDRDKAERNARKMERKLDRLTNIFREMEQQRNRTASEMDDCLKRASGYIYGSPEHTNAQERLHHHLGSGDLEAEESAMEKKRRAAQHRRERSSRETRRQEREEREDY